MLAKPTWPNYRGSEVDGVKAILKAQKLDKDVTYGYTKLFVQSPESLFQLVSKTANHVYSNRGRP